MASMRKFWQASSWPVTELCALVYGLPEQGCLFLNLPRETGAAQAGPGV